MKKVVTGISLFLIASCSNNNLDTDINRLLTEDYYLGTPGSKLFYRTTTKETQEKYHYSECRKKILNGDDIGNDNDDDDDDTADHADCDDADADCSLHLR